MANNLLKLSAIDTLMFRDGRPFNQNDAGASEAASVFPPWPPTIVGAVRAKLWQDELKGSWHPDRLGSGTNWQKGSTLGTLKFGAPLVMKNGSPVFPVPLHIVEGKNARGEKAITSLRPGKSIVSDLGEQRLPVPESKTLMGLKTIEDRWVNLSGMKKILDGEARKLKESDFIKRTDLWTTEPRVGVGIDPDTRTTSDGRLYMASHIRMADDTILAVEVTGGEEAIVDSLRPLAGEHRMASITMSRDAFSLPEGSNNGFKSQSDQTCYCAIAISPVVPDPDRNFAIAGLVADNIVSASLGKPVSIGGWDFEAKTPIALRQCIPAGSVWFMQGGDVPPNGSKIGLAQEWGFGQILIGRWHQNTAGEAK